MQAGREGAAQRPGGSLYGAGREEPAGAQPVQSQAAPPPGPDKLPAVWRMILTRRLRVQGLLVSDFGALHGDFLRDMGQWVKEGRVKYREDIVDGFENAPRALIGLLRGENFGKLVVRVAERSK